jgi:hypothetical protein
LPKVGLVRLRRGVLSWVSTPRTRIIAYRPIRARQSGRRWFHGGIRTYGFHEMLLVPNKPAKIGAETDNLPPVSFGNRETHTIGRAPTSFAFHALPSVMLKTPFVEIVIGKINVEPRSDDA